MTTIPKCTVRYGTVLMPTLVKQLPVLALSEDAIRRIPVVPEKRIKSEDRYEKIKKVSISAVLGSTDDKKALYLWQKQKMEEMGAAGFRAFMNARLKEGREMHDVIKNILELFSTNQKISKDEAMSLVGKNTEKVVKKYIESVFPFLLDLNDPQDVVVEQATSHPFLAYQGRFDAVIRYKDSLCLVDWKTSPSGSHFNKHGEESLSFPTYCKQLAAYISAFNHDSRYFDREMIRNGLLVSVKEDGASAEVFELDQSSLTNYFELFKTNLDRFWSSVRDSGAIVDFAYDPAKNM